MKFWCSEDGDPFIQIYFCKLGYNWNVHQRRVKHTSSYSSSKTLIEDGFEKPGLIALFDVDDTLTASRKIAFYLFSITEHFILGSNSSQSICDHHLRIQILEVCILRCRQRSYSRAAGKTKFDHLQLQQSCRAFRATPEDYPIAGLSEPNGKIASRELCMSLTLITQPLGIL
ncbi:hypothetical protein L1987_13247 [Smallanthus sonchifolius]|uniref:Uncharacterized protein n=1 Tax=Smallanthus sonchifolius TaxID=185202 RepID=A0ACB9JFY3_9ASTR|nr:hypothetical protein L1987_13247 [Smallanthus sonchifolius]